MNNTNKYKTKYFLLKKLTGITSLHNIISKNTIFKPIKANAYFNGSSSNSNIKGIVLFEEIFTENNIIVKVSVDLEGFEPETIHGFHIHEYGDLSRGCDSMCAHFNPYNKTHGGRDEEGRENKERHVGDLGNITADTEGKVKTEFTDHLIKLRGFEANIIGRGLIIHEDEDDCGKGSSPNSKTTGNSGKRIACVVIGYASE